MAVLSAVTVAPITAQNSLGGLSVSQTARLSSASAFAPSKSAFAASPRLSRRTAVVVAVRGSANDEATAERFRLNNLAPQPGSRRPEKRKGRGYGGGQGGSCGFGMRGQRSRSGPGVRPGFEGGQMPLYRRLPKLKGIAGGMGAGLPKYVTVNLSDLDSLGLDDGEEISLETLKADGLLNPTGRDRGLPLKVLGDGEINAKVTIKAASFSATAREKLEAAGCTLVQLPGKKKFLGAVAEKRRVKLAEFLEKKGVPVSA